MRIQPHSPWRPGKARNGKVARLPDKTRQIINELILDGVTYDAIIARLGPDGQHLNYHNLKCWRKGGYQDWLLARQKADVSQLRKEFAGKLIDITNPMDLASRTTAAIANEYLQFLLDLDIDSLKDNLAVDAATFTSIINSLAKASLATLKCDKARTARTLRHLALTNPLPKPPPSRPKTAPPCPVQPTLVMSPAPVQASAPRSPPDTADLANSNKINPASTNEHQ